MTRKAHAVLERSMHDAAAGLEGRFVMAHNAERSSILNGFKGLRRCCRVVARIAARRSDRIMDARLEELWLR